MPFFHSVQIIATSHDLGPQKVAGRKGNRTLISGKSRLVKYYNLARSFKGCLFFLGLCHFFWHERWALYVKTRADCEFGDLLGQILSRLWGKFSGLARWWFEAYSFIVNLTWEDDPIWQQQFKRVEPTKQFRVSSPYNPKFLGSWVRCWRWTLFFHVSQFAKNGGKFPPHLLTRKHPKETIQWNKATLWWKVRNLIIITAIYR